MENYRKFHSAQVEFPDGIIGIMGPNGAGKSTLIEAISWVLYGNSSVDRTVKEGIKRAGAGPNEDCSVTIIFELGGVEYQVKRSMRGKNLKVDAELLGNGEVLHPRSAQSPPLWRRSWEWITVHSSTRFSPVSGNCPPSRP